MKRSKIDRNLSISYVSTDNIAIPRENKNKSEYRTNFKFESKKILHLWLAAVIPGPTSSALKYDMQNKKIYGQKKQCEKMISLCDHFLQNRKLKIIYGLQIDYNSQLYLQYKIDAIIYTRQQVEQACQLLINQFNQFQLEKEVQAILRRKNYVLVSIDQRIQDQLQQALDFIKNNIITRSIINQAKKQKYHQANQKKKDIPTQYCYKYQERKLEDNKIIKNIQQSQGSFYRKKQNINKLINEQTKQYKQPIFCTQYSQDHLNLKDFKFWIKNQDILQINQFSFQETKGKIKKKLYTQNRIDKKITIINDYLNNNKNYNLKSNRSMRQRQLH